MPGVLWNFVVMKLSQVKVGAMKALSDIAFSDGKGVHRSLQLFGIPVCMAVGIRNSWRVCHWALDLVERCPISSEACQFRKSSGSSFRRSCLATEPEPVISL